MEHLSIETPSHMDPDSQESCFPFHVYFKPPHPAELAPPLFHQYKRLPEEIQLQILQTCDARTTFQLMRTCSGIRRETEKFFWSHPDLWFPAQSWSVISRKAPTSSLNSPRSGLESRIAQVDLEFESYVLDHLWPADFTAPSSGNVAQTPDEFKANRFRQKFRHVYPSCKRVVLNDLSIRECEPFICQVLSAIGLALSKDMTVFISLRFRPVGSCLHKVTYCLDPNYQWTPMQAPLKRDRIQLPRKNITGIVGDYLKIMEKLRDLGLENRALRERRNEVYEEYHFGSQNKIPFTCPKKGCGKEFEKHGLWTAHLDTDGRDHDEWHTNLSCKLRKLISRLPAELEEILAQEELANQEARRFWDERWNQYKASWGDEGSKERQLFEEMFLRQLKEDPACGCKGDPELSPIFRGISQIWDLEEQYSC